MIEKIPTLSNEKFNQENSKFAYPIWQDAKKNSFLHFKCFNLAIYEVNIFEKFSTCSTNLKQDPIVQSPKNKFLNKIFSYALEKAVLVCFL
jgi:hypothetical protein